MHEALFENYTLALYLLSHSDNKRCNSLLQSLYLYHLKQYTNPVLAMK